MVDPRPFSHMGEYGTRTLIMKNPRREFLKWRVDVIRRRGRRDPLNTNTWHGLSVRSHVYRSPDPVCSPWAEISNWTRRTPNWCPKESAVAACSLAKQNLTRRCATLCGEMAQAETLQSHENKVCGIEVKVAPPQPARLHKKPE